jgi:hypothetical protein
MNLPIPGFPIISVIGFVSIPLVLMGIMALTTRVSFRLCKTKPPKLKFMVAVAFLQILLLVLTLYVVELIKYEPFLMIGAALGITILSNLIFIKMFLKNGWKQSLGIWAIAGVMQMAFLPVCSGVMLMGWFAFNFMNHTPQP